MPMTISGPFKINNKGRDIPEGHNLKLVDGKGAPACKHAVIEVVCHNRMLNDFTVCTFPPSFNPHLVPVALKRAGENIERDLIRVEYQMLDVEAGEVLNIQGVEHIVAGIIDGHEYPTVVSDWTNPKAMDVPLKMMHAGWNKDAMWSANVEFNRPNIKHGIKTLYDTVCDKGVIIAGSGPSLQTEQLKNIDTKKWDIIACNDAYRLLDGQAKYFFLLEAEANKKWWSKIGSKTTAILCIHSHPEAGTQPWNAKFWFTAQPYKDGVPANAELAPELGALHEQLNCTMSAFHLAYMMGYKKIVFVGCDFAYTGGKSHVGEQAEYREVIYGNELDVNGGMVLTDKVLSLQARCHEAETYFLERAGVKVINCTEGGIMTGIACKPLAEVLNG